jgi:hypothetical protein
VSSGRTPLCTRPFPLTVYVQCARSGRKPAWIAGDPPSESDRRVVVRTGESEEGDSLASRCLLHAPFCVGLGVDAGDDSCGRQGFRCFVFPGKTAGRNEIPGMPYGPRSGKLPWPLPLSEPAEDELDRLDGCHSDLGQEPPGTDPIGCRPCPFGSNTAQSVPGSIDASMQSNQRRVFTYFNRRRVRVRKGRGTWTPPRVGPTG